jgi:hypothetical protein
MYGYAGNDGCEEDGKCRSDNVAEHNVGSDAEIAVLEDLEIE